MNTNALKSFAQQARKKLMQQVADKMDYVLEQDSSALRDQASAIQKLKKEIENSSKEQVIEKVAYTWFNRLMALRFMDVNEYQPLGIGVVTPKEGFTLPELLDEAKQGDISDDLEVDNDRVFGLIDGRIKSPNGQNEAYKILLIGACNYLHKVFPFLFEKINDYTDLLLPDDLTSEFSIVYDIRQGMTEGDCQEVELIGWLYQFYISEKKDEVFAKKGKVEKDEIPSATQLFTPRWIVEYMVQNTLGKLWLQNRPQSALREQMPYFIESPSMEAEVFLKVDSVEEIMLLDQACGSGHILVYTFDLLAKIYEEEGYSSSEIPQLILKNNLFGFEIDERASQLAGFALMMKARAYYRRIFRKEVKPNILCYQDLNLSEAQLNDCLAEVEADKNLIDDLKLMQQATNLGSLIQPQSTAENRLKFNQSISNLIEKGTIYKANLTQIQTAIAQLDSLGKKYHCVVDNPPYMGGGNMNKPLADFVKKNYPDSKADLMACFMEAGFNMLLDKGYISMVNMHSWMFLSSFEKLRNTILNNYQFETILHLGMEAFEGIIGKVVQTVAWVLKNQKPLITKEFTSVRLVDYYDKRRWEKQNHFFDKEHRYTANQKDFQKIPGSPIGYWLSENALNSFMKFDSLSNICDTKKGLATSDNDRFLRLWNEVEYSKSSLNSFIETKWYPHQKGGPRRKWYGNNEYIINWEKDGYEIKNFKDDKGKLRSRPQNLSYNFKQAVTWSKITSGSFSARLCYGGSLFDDAAAICYNKDIEILDKVNAFMNSKVSQILLNCINPTLNIQIGDIGGLPISIEFKVNKCYSFNVSLTKSEWNSRETSWDFENSPLISQNKNNLTEAYESYCQHWQAQYMELHQNEEELNKQFIEIYGLQEELTPDVELKDITILRDEVDQKALKEISDNFKSGWQLTASDYDLAPPQEGEEYEIPPKYEWEQKAENSYTNLQLPFNQAEIIKQFISYAVGCMFGRYSLDKDGLILANQGETLKDYIEKVDTANLSFTPDEDNIIPVLDEEWFEDDITARFEVFLKASFGTENFEQNKYFVEESLGKSIRKYFMADFYKDHIKRYKKRPIYWQFSSPKGSFNALIYMHRYNPDTLNEMLNGYLRAYQEKLKGYVQTLEHQETSGTASEQNKATKQLEKIRKILLELKEYERDLFALATKRISIDLDDGVLVNYNRFGKVIKDVAGLNDAKTKKKVKAFDWVDTEGI